MGSVAQEITADEVIARIHAHMSTRREASAPTSGPAAPANGGPVDEAFGGAGTCVPVSAEALRLPKLALQPEFEPKAAGGYRLRELLDHHDVSFVENAYRAILKRGPDSLGMRHYVEQLRAGKLTKVQILGRIRYSREGRKQRVGVDGLILRLALEEAGRVPVLGYALRWVTALVLLPRAIAGARRFEAYSLYLHETIAAAFNRTGFIVEDKLNEFVGELRQVASSLGQVRDGTLSEMMAQAKAEKEAQSALAELFERRSAREARARQALAERLDRCVAEEAAARAVLVEHAEQRATAEAAAREGLAASMSAESVAREALAERLDRWVAEEAAARAALMEHAEQRASAEAAAREGLAARISAESVTREALAERLDRCVAEEAAARAVLVEHAEQRASAEAAAREGLASRISAEAVAREALGGALNQRLALEVGAREELSKSAETRFAELRETIAAQAETTRRIGHEKQTLLEELETRVRNETSAREALGELMAAAARERNAIQERLERTERGTERLRSKNSLQERRLGIFLEEARRRLPEPFDEDQLRGFQDEALHRIDAFLMGFEDTFRGSREDIKDRLRVYLPILKKAGVGGARSSVVDVGTGRGEWLELLEEEGMRGCGIDTNRLLVAQCRERGLNALEADAVAHLRSIPDGRVGAVTGFHLIEHLPLDVLIQLLDETVRVLRPRGVAIFETPNPANVLVGSHTFYLDPTHRNPLPAPVMRFLAEERGLCRIEILELNAYPEGERVPVRDQDPLALRFNEYFFGPRDYALIGRKV